MPASLSQITRNTATVELNYGDLNINIEYYPAKITEKTFLDIQALGSLTAETVIEGFGSLNDLIVHLVKSWDLYEDDEQTTLFPLDVDRLAADLPFVFRVQVIMAIMGHIRPEMLALQTQN